MSDRWNEQARELSARKIERRRFLQGALGVSGLLLAQGAGLRRAAFSREAVGGLPIPKESGLDHIVVTMMENRSVDHLFGWIPGIDGVLDGVSNPKRLSVPQGLCSAVPFESPLAVADPTEVQRHRLPRHCHKPDPDHGWTGSRIERNHGLMNGFVERSGDHAMGYYEREDIPFLGWLGSEFTTFSRYFSSVLGPTYPNRLYWLSAQGGEAKGNPLPLPNQYNPMPTGYRWPTIFDRLSSAGVNWAWYATDLPTIWLFFRHNYLDPGRIRHISDYYADAAAGRLPNVAFLDPSYITIGNDLHPGHGGDLRLGDRYVHDTFTALAESPHWERSAYILTFDEAGGWYDHVVPPRAADERARPDNHCEDWGQLGFRVPTVVASPFALRRSVGERVYDHTSILKLIEWRFSLSPLTARDAAANNLAEILTFEPGQKQVELPAGRPDVPLSVETLACSFQGVGTTTQRVFGGNPAEPLPEAPVPAPARPADMGALPHQDMRELADAGYFGRFDFREQARLGAWRT
ncbi:MAG TPA: alkaline phosphatase family protein [Actinomycetota bacterium]|nr:alkaline phosphatase family protein [Actinomycetota bacterium]